MQNSLSLSQEQAQNILAMIGLNGPVRVALMREYNHIYRLDCSQQTFFLKIHTKDWYPPEDAETGYSVAHEASAWSMLASCGLATPEVLLACQDRKNPLGRPFLLTRQVPGVELTTLLEQQNASEILYVVGNYLRQMHSLQFDYAGYLLGNGPTAPPDPANWQHQIWTIEQLQRNAHNWVQTSLPEEATSLRQQVEQHIQRMPEILTPEYIPPHFTHGDCSPTQILMIQENGSWRVSGLLDMEVASAGDSGADLVTFCMRMAQYLPATSFWWLPFFDGYGRVPDFAGFRLRLLAGWNPYDASIWPGTGEAAFEHLFRASDWQTLFSHAHLNGNE